MAVPPVVEPSQPPPRSPSRLLPTLHYCLRIDTHVYAFAIAANMLLSFFPFMVLILSLAQNVLHWKGVVDVIYASLRDHLPEDPGLVDFVMGNLRATVEARGHVELLSVLLLILSSNGIFIPLEVALNRLWGI